MVQIRLKNTFLDLSFEGEEGSDLDSEPLSSSGKDGSTTRSRSAGASPGLSGSHRGFFPRLPQEKDNEQAPQLRSLNRLLLQTQDCSWQRSVMETGKQHRTQDLSPWREMPVKRRREGECRRQPEFIEATVESGCWQDGATAAVRLPSRTPSPRATPRLAMTGQPPHAALSWLLNGTEVGSTGACFNGEHGPQESGTESPLHKEYRHKSVPKRTNLEEEHKNIREGVPPTTLMIRNLPNRMSRDELIAELHELGFAGAFDFVYVPLDSCRRSRHRRHGVRKGCSNVGYAFINFVDMEWAARCASIFQDRGFSGSRKTASVSIAHVQGLEANLAHFQGSAVTSTRTRQRGRGPVVLASGNLDPSCPLLAPR